MVTAKDLHDCGRDLREHGVVRVGHYVVTFGDGSLLAVARDPLGEQAGESPVILKKNITGYRIKGNGRVMAQTDEEAIARFIRRLQAS